MCAVGEKAESVLGQPRQPIYRHAVPVAASLLTLRSIHVHCCILCAAVLACITPVVTILVEKPERDNSKTTVVVLTSATTNQTAIGGFTLVGIATGSGTRHNIASALSIRTGRV